MFSEYHPSAMEDSAWLDDGFIDFEDKGLRAAADEAHLSSQSTFRRACMHSCLHAFIISIDPAYAVIY